MRFKKNKIILNFTLVNIFIFLANDSFAFAAIKNTEHFLYIESNMQLLDIKSNVVTFIGNVVVTQKNIKINADKLTINNPSSKRGKEIINGYGNPAIFYQMQSNNKLIKGHALKIHYELEKNIITLTGNAYLEQCDNNITSDKITYLVKEQQIQVCSEKGKHITMVLVPTQLQENKIMPRFRHRNN